MQAGEGFQKTSPRGIQNQVKHLRWSSLQRLKVVKYFAKVVYHLCLTGSLIGLSQQTFTCSKSTTKTMGKCERYVEAPEWYQRRRFSVLTLNILHTFF